MGDDLVINAMADPLWRYLLGGMIAAAIALLLREIARP